MIPTAFRTPVPLGIGCTALPSHPDVLASVRDLVDLVELRPEHLAREIPGSRPGATHLRLDRDLTDPVVRAVAGLPVIVHGRHLSIGTAAGWNQDAVGLLDDIGRLVRYRWHSEHLGFVSAPDRFGTQRSAGIPLPLPRTAEAASMVAARADLLARRTGRTFLLESAACALPDLPADPGWDEATFLTEVCRRSTCGLLLDLGSLLLNCSTAGVDAPDLLERMPLDRVVEVHVADGQAGPGTPAAAGAVPDQTWDLLDAVLDRAPQVAAVVVDVAEESFPALGIDAYRAQLRRARDHWDRSRSGAVGVRR